VEDPLEVAETAELVPELAGAGLEELNHLAQDGEENVNALPEASPGSLQATSLHFGDRRFGLSRRLGVEALLDLSDGNRPAGQSVFGQHTDGMPAEKTQEASDPFALDQLVAIRIAVILAMAMDGMVGIDRTGGPVAVDE
jgi:hypothetical protein